MVIAVKLALTYEVRSVLSCMLKSHVFVHAPVVLRVALCGDFKKSFGTRFFIFSCRNCGAYIETVIYLVSKVSKS